MTKETYFEDGEGRKIELLLRRAGREDFIKRIQQSRGTKSELDFEIMKLAKHAQAITNTQQQDIDLIRAKEEVRELKAPYNEQTKLNKALTRYVALILEEDYGKDLGLDPQLEESEDSE